MARPNHGSAVSTYAREQQAAREEGGPQGIGPQVSAFARNKADNDDFDFEDGVITVVKADGSTQSFETFVEALLYADDGDTLQVGAGVYTEAIDLHKSVIIIGEEGAVLDGSGIQASAGTQGAIQLFEGFSGGSISGLEIVAVQDGNALVSIIGQAVEGVTLTGNTFDAGANTVGPLVYLNPGADGFVFEDNVFEGAFLAHSPLLGIEGDNVQVINNSFGETPGTYYKVEVFHGMDGSTDDIVLTGNSGLDSGDVFYA